MRKISEEKLALERQRLEGMREFENKYSDLGAVAGIDEAGRGPLAGPVVAAAVILPKDIFLPFLNDSKKVTEKRRDVLFDQIKQEAIAYGIGIASNALIDDIKGDHPRLRGEHKKDVGGFVGGTGSPPPTRGTLADAKGEYR